jgi:hypothetical protein
VEAKDRHEIDGNPGADSRRENPSPEADRARAFRNNTAGGEGVSLPFYHSAKREDAMNNKDKIRMMIGSKSALLLASAASGAIGYLIGSTPPHHTVTLAHVAIASIHPAALHVLTEDGKEHRYPIYDLNRDWASPLVKNPGRHWYLQLESSSECPSRYFIRTLEEDKEPNRLPVQNHAKWHTVVAPSIQARYCLLQTASQRPEIA